MRIAPLVLALALASTGCGRVVQADTGAEGSAPSVPAASDFVYLPWDGDVPVWPLTPIRTEELYGSWMGIDSMDPENPSGVLSEAWLRSNALPGECGDGYGDTDLFDLCLGKYLRDRGATSSAVDLFGRYFITAWDVQTAGPIQVARVSDWGYFGGSVGMGAFFIHTPQGFLTTAGALGELQAAAVEVASASDTFRRISAAVGNIDGPLTFGWPGVGWGPLRDPEDPYGGWAGSISAPEDLLVADPALAEQTGARWTVPYVLRLGAGCGVCTIGIASHFALDFTTEGIPADVRFISFCVLSPESTGIYPADLKEIAAIAAELPAC